MAGQIIVSSIKTDSDNSISFLANTGATIFSANLANGLSASSFGDNTITSDKISGTVAVSKGGTGASSLTSNAVLLGNGSSSIATVSPGTTGNVLTSNNGTWASEAPVIPQGVPTGTIATFAGDPGEGWLECNGQVVSQSTYSDLYSKVGLLADGFSTTSYIPALLSTSITSGTAQFRAGIAYGNSTYVAARWIVENHRAYTIFTSTDAVTWTQRSVGFPTISSNFIPVRVLYTDKFVMAASVDGTASTNRNIIYTSTDGISWTTRTTVNSNNPHDLEYNGSTYVMPLSVGSINCLQTSTDAITWTLRTTPVAMNPQSGIAYGNNTWVLGGYGDGDAGATPVIQTSTDAITWTYRSVGWNFAYPRAVTFAAGKFWLLGSDTNAGVQGPVWTSTDGITWSQNTVLSRLIPIVSGVYEDTTNSLVYAFGMAGNALNGTFTATLMAISGDNGSTWEVRPVGADVFNTQTSGNAGPANRIGHQPVLVNHRIVTVANGKIFYGGYMSTLNKSNFNLGTGSIMSVINSPYSYQTDTQFVVPMISTAISGSLTPAHLYGVKSSLANDSVIGKNLKYYIKT